MLNVLKALTFVSLLLVPCYSQAENSSEYYEKALKSFQANDFEASYIHLKNSLKENEDNLPAKILMGRVLLISGYLVEAEDVLQEALSAGADPSLVADPLGKVWLFTNQNEKIVDAEFNNLTPQSSTDWQIIVATAQLNMGNIAGARKEYQSALITEPTNVRTLNALASLEIRDENYPTSKDYLNRSFMVEPNNPQTWLLQGNYYLRQQQIAEAISAYQKSYAIDPEDPVIKRSLVTAHLQNQDVDAAKALLNKILEQTPGDPTAMLLKAWLLAKNQMSDEAAKELENLSAQLAGLSGEVLQNDPSLLYVSALSAYALQNYRQAKVHFIQYLTFVPNHIEAIALLAKTHIKLNEPKPALEAMQRHERQLMEKIDTALLLAELYLANDKSFKAVDIISRLKSQYPNDPSVELLDIKTLMSRGKYDLALEKLDASEHSQRNIGYIMTRTQLYIETGRFAEADAIANKLLEVSPDNINFLNLKAAIQIKLKQFAKAEEYLDKALLINPEHFSARFNKANILSAKGDHEKALKLALELNTIQPDSVNVLVLLARSQFNNDDANAAIDNLKRVLEKDIDNLPALELLTAVYTQQGDTERALRQINIAIKTRPDEPKYQMQRAQLYLTLKQHDRAKRELRKINQLVEKDPVALVELSKIQFRAGELDDAKKSIADAYAIHPDSFFLATEYVRLHLASNDLTSARAMLSKWLKLRAGDPQLLVLSGDVYSAQQKTTEAAQEYLKALEGTSNYQNALLKLYQLASRGVAAKEFEQKLIQIVDRAPEYYFSRNLLADFYVNQGRLDDALPHYDKLLDVKPLVNQMFILNNLANIYINKDLSKAEQYINQALEIGNENAALFDTYGWITALKGQHEQALTILRKSFAMNSDDPSNQYHLAYTLHKLGRDTEAKTSLNRALSSPRYFIEKDAAQALLEQLQ
ncbi:XrtA/PEP-CTERM system TPR-repeat protein PrsT [Aliiglaciecola sp. LCG003]|uniref:XrtA/PEP-CTERM system TPR-repeat protein PrsT n=1 Tax=Aliiglaciecola sp. LCG003 TaxID=3053655 RepID=UPI002572B924|nr:XrtA/PEP-CTERM system TPR-repeat protein PrsT [Aliiglaciecola sp. LCG003]WJG08401.1 PEP-CTERM system TPR-repeat protein PrsT [Aliiglaciecola sp. LCG003]